MRKRILASNIVKNVLKSTNHVTEEAYSNHFDQQLKQVFIWGFADDVAVSDTWECGNYPIKTGDVAVPITISLNSILYQDVKPPFAMLKVILTNEHPKTSKKVRRHDDLEREPKELDEDFDGVTWQEVLG